MIQSEILVSCELTTMANGLTADNEVVKTLDRLNWLRNACWGGAEKMKILADGQLITFDQAVQLLGSTGDN